MAIAPPKIALFELAEKSVNKINYVIGKLQRKFFHMVWQLTMFSIAQSTRQINSNVIKDDVITQHECLTTVFSPRYACHWWVSVLRVSCLYLNCMISSMGREELYAQWEWRKESHCDWLQIKSNKPCRINSPGNCHSIQIYVHPNKQIKEYAFGSNFVQPLTPNEFEGQSFSLLDLYIYLFAFYSECRSQSQTT